MLENFTSLPLLLGGSWASGINMYMTTAGLGIAHRMGWLTLPGQLDTLSHPGIIGLAILMYAVEFVADKIPFVDSLWDSIHTFIRPVGGGILGYMALGEATPLLQSVAALMTGSIALSSHLTKATARIAVNSVPTGIGNSVASVTEDAGVFGVLYLIVKHPIIATIVVVALIIFSIWFLRIMFRFLRKIFAFGKKEQLVQV
jgi:hypothetical protein